MRNNRFDNDEGIDYSPETIISLCKIFEIKLTFILVHWFQEVIKY